MDLRGDRPLAHPHPTALLALALLGCGDPVVPAGSAEPQRADPPATSATADLVAPPISGDFDGDGLSNQQERLTGTDPEDPDTDGDGLTDGDEALVLGTDPLDADTDDDWVPDGLEVEAGTDPTNAEPPSLSVDLLEANRLITVTVRGGPPDGEVELRYGLIPSQRCPPDHNGVCWVMEDPTDWALSTTDGLGTVSLDVVVPDVADGTPILVQASVIAPDDTYLASAPLEALVAHPPRACGDVTELDPALAPATLDDGASWLVCADLPQVGGCEPLGAIDAGGLFDAALGEPLPPEWSVQAQCHEVSAQDACCYTLFADDTTR